MWILLFFVSFFSAAADDCAVGSYVVDGVALKRCEPGIMGGTSYGHPLNSEILQFLKSDKSAALDPGFQRLFDLNRDGFKAYLEKGIQDHNYQTRITGDPTTLADLNALAAGVNTELGMDPYIAGFKEAQQAEATEKNKSKGVSLDDMMNSQLAQGNATSLRQLQRNCPNNRSANGELNPVRVNFEDGEQQITMLTGIEKTSEGYQIEYVVENRDEPVQKRLIKKDASGVYIYIGKDGVSYPLIKGKEFEIVSSKLVGTMQNFGGRMSNTCVFATNSATTGYGAPDVINNGSSGQQPAGTVEVR